MTNTDHKSTIDCIIEDAIAARDKEWVDGIGKLFEKNGDIDTIKFIRGWQQLKQHMGASK